MAFRSITIITFLLLVISCKNEKKAEFNSKKLQEKSILYAIDIDFPDTVIINKK